METKLGVAVTAGPSWVSAWFGGTHPAPPPATFRPPQQWREPAGHCGVRCLWPPTGGLGTPGGSREGQGRPAVLGGPAPVSLPHQASGLPRSGLTLPWETRGELFYIGDFKTIITLCVRNVQRNL